MFLTDMADVLRAAGQKVVEVPGWKSRSTWQVGVTLRGWVVHHTGPWSLPGIVNVLRDGRSDLAGPLSQLGFDPHTQTWYVVAAGRANHNGFGHYVSWCPWGNDSVGIEVFNTGTEVVPAAGYNALVKGLLALSIHYERFGIAGHKETDPARKWDPGTINMVQLRADVAAGGAMLDDMPNEAFFRQETDRLIAALRDVSAKETSHRQTIHDSFAKRYATINRSIKAATAYLKARFGNPGA